MCQALINIFFIYLSIYVNVFVDKDICTKESLMSEETGISEENPRVQEVDPRTLSHATTAVSGDQTRSARS